MAHIDVLESLLEQIHALSAPRTRPVRLSTTRTAEELATQLVEALHLHSEHHSVIENTLLDYAAQESGWRDARKAPAEGTDAPVATMVRGDVEYLFATYKQGQWHTRAGSPITILNWYELPMLPED